MTQYLSELKAQLQRQQCQREAITALLQQNRENVKGWLQMLSDACQCEIGHLVRSENGDIADGDLASTYKILREAVEGLRDAQELGNKCDSQIADTESDIESAEDEAEVPA